MNSIRLVVTSILGGLREGPAQMPARGLSGTGLRAGRLELGHGLLDRLQVGGLPGGGELVREAGGFGVGEPTFGLAGADEILGRLVGGLQVLEVPALAL